METNTFIDNETYETLQIRYNIIHDNIKNKVYTAEQLIEVLKEIDEINIKQDNIVKNNKVDKNK